jgi:hypothetical protein
MPSASPALALARVLARRSAMMLGVLATHERESRGRHANLVTASTRRSCLTRARETGASAANLWSRPWLGHVLLFSARDRELRKGYLA